MPALLNSKIDATERGDRAIEQRPHGRGVADVGGAEQGRGAVEAEAAAKAAVSASASARRPTSATA